MRYTVKNLFFLEFDYTLHSEKDVVPQTLSFTLATRYAVKNLFFLEFDNALRSEKDVVPQTKFFVTGYAARRNLLIQVEV